MDSDSHMQTKLLKWNRTIMRAIVATVVAAVVAVMLWHFVDVVRGVEWINPPLKVADCNNQVVTFTTTLPAGHYYNIIFAIPCSEHLSSKLRIHVTVSDSTRTVADFAVASGDAEECNWLHSSDLQGYILSRNNLMRDKVHGRETYKFTIQFSEALPKDSSLWLSWLQNYKD